MNNYIKILNNQEKQKITEQLEEQFGIKKIPGIVIQRGAERLFLFQGDLNERQIKNFETVRIPIERVGVYFAKLMPGEGIKLSIEGSQILKKGITKNLFELSDAQVEEWMYGRDLQIATGKKGFLIMKYQDDFLGTGKASENKIGNFIPKNRRLKVKNL